MGCLDRTHPVAERFVDRVAKSSRAGRDRPDLGTQELHAKDVWLLASDVFFAHVDDALKPEAGTGGCGGHPVLTGARLGDDPTLAHPDGQQGLAQRVVDFVRSGMVEVFTLQIDLCPADLFGQLLGEVQWRRPSDIVTAKLFELGLKRLIRQRGRVLPVELLERSRQGLRDILPAKGAESSPVIWKWGVTHKVFDFSDPNLRRRPKSGLLIAGSVY